jgi:hypothetical protein
MSALFRKIIKAEFSYPSWFSQPVKDLLNKILLPNPDKRHTVAQIKEDGWFCEGGYEEDEDENVESKVVDTADVFDEAEEMEVSGKNGSRPVNPQSMNAFELITMCGGLDLTPMFDKQAQTVKKYTRFHSNAAPLVILNRISEALTGLGTEHKVQQSTFKIKVNHTTEKGQLTATVQVFSIAPGCALLMLAPSLPNPSGSDRARVLQVAPRRLAKRPGRLAHILPLLQRYPGQCLRAHPVTRGQTTRTAAPVSSCQQKLVCRALCILIHCTSARPRGSVRRHCSSLKRRH